MALPVMARMRIGGRLYADANWSIGVNVTTNIGTDPFSGGTNDVQEALLAWCNAVKQLQGGSIVGGGLQGLLSTAGTIEYIRGARIGLDGRESEVALVEFDTPVRGTGSGFMSAQSAVVLSLQTGRPGASNRGRLYWPGIGASLGNGRLSPSTCSNVAATAATLLQEIPNAANKFGSPVIPDLTPVVASRRAGTVHAIGTVRVGNRLDSQRRRAEGQKEVYSVASVAQ